MGENKYEIHLTVDQLRLIQQGVLELPAKNVLEFINELDRQVQANEQQKQQTQGTTDHTVEGS